jgi:stage II sporulation protein M
MSKYFVDNYKKCWKFFKECEWYFVFVFGVFASMFLVGFVYPIFFREEIFAKIAELMLELEGKSSLELIWFIFLNNLTVGFFSIVLGVLIGFFPMVTCIANGYMVGFVSREVVEVEGFFALWRLLPHGIFELPAIIFSIGIGIRIGVSMFGVSGYRKKLKYNFKEGLRFFVFVVFPLLLVAGIIEGILIGIVA